MHQIISKLLHQPHNAGHRFWPPTPAHTNPRTVILGCRYRRHHHHYHHNRHYLLLLFQRMVFWAPLSLLPPQADPLPESTWWRQSRSTFTHSHPVDWDHHWPREMLATRPMYLPPCHPRLGRHRHQDNASQ